MITATLTLPEEAARKLAETLAEYAAVGADAVDLYEEAPGTWRVTAYFAEDDRERRAAVASLAANATVNGQEPEWRDLKDADWVKRSQESLPPVRAGRFLVYGRHAKDQVRANDFAILIEAGLAFGTGHHGTTQGCLLAIEARLKLRPVRSAIDIGTGSGVLAIALAKHDVQVLGTDIDRVAVRIARENARLNGVGARVVVQLMPKTRGRLPVALRAGGYDVVVANILMGPLITLAPAIAAAVAPSGSVILSGLLPDQRIPIVATYRLVGLRLERWFIHEGWLTVVMERPAKPDSWRGGARP